MKTETLDAGYVRVTDPCPKCGSQYGFLHSKPTYHVAQTVAVDMSGHGFLEHLDFECGVCDFRVERPTADSDVLRLPAIP